MTATLTNPVLGQRIESFPCPLAGFGTSAQDLVTAWTPGIAGQILGFEAIVLRAGTGTGATQTFQLYIGSTAVTGLAQTLTLAGTATTGAVKPSGTMTGATNTAAGGYFKATDTWTITCAASGTVFTAGDVVFKIKYAKLDGQ